MVYFWAFYVVPLVYISGFVALPYCLDDCSFVVLSEIRQVDSSHSILLSQVCFGYSRFVCVCVPTQIMEIICSSSVKNTVGGLKRLHWIYRLPLVVYSFSLYWFFQFTNMVYFSTYLCHLWFISSGFYSFLYIGLLFL